MIRKLVILAREAGYKVEKTDVEKHLFIPEYLFEGSIDDFWKHLPELDADFEARRKKLEAEGNAGALWLHSTMARQAWH